MGHGGGSGGWRQKGRQLCPPPTVFLPNYVQSPDSILTGATDGEQYVRETNYAVTNANKDMSQGDGVKRSLTKAVTSEMSPEEQEGANWTKSLGESLQQDQN